MLRKIYRQYKKDKGAADDANSLTLVAIILLLLTTQLHFQLPMQNQANFTLQMSSVKSQGTKDFKSRWGNRPNVDNWNRAAVASGKVEVDKKASAALSEAETNLSGKQLNAKKGKGGNTKRTRYE